MQVLICIPKMWTTLVGNLEDIWYVEDGHKYVLYNTKYTKVPVAYILEAISYQIIIQDYPITVLNVEISWKYV